MPDHDVRIHIRRCGPTRPENARAVEVLDNAAKLLCVRVPRDVFVTVGRSLRPLEVVFEYAIRDYVNDRLSGFSCISILFGIDIDESVSEGQAKLSIEKLVRWIEKWLDHMLSRTAQVSVSS